MFYKFHKVTSHWFVLPQTNFSYASNECTTWHLMVGYKTGSYSLHIDSEQRKGLIQGVCSSWRKAQCIVLHAFFCMQLLKMTNSGHAPVCTKAKRSQVNWKSITVVRCTHAVETWGKMEVWTSNVAFTLCAACVQT